MKKKAYSTKLICLIIISVMLTGCWDYDEVEDNNITIGYGVDYIKETKSFKLTCEVIDVEGSTETAGLNSTIFESKGLTVFDAVRKFVEVAGNVLFWAHCRLAILSDEYAETGIEALLDYTNRDAEYRPDVMMLVSNGSASSIFNTKKDKSDLLSFMLHDSLSNNKKVYSFKSIDMWEFSDIVAKPGYEATVPIVSVKDNAGKTRPIISGTAVFKLDKMVGTLTPEETLYFLFLSDSIGNQLLTYDYTMKGHANRITLELWGNKTKIKTNVEDGKITFNVEVKPELGLALESVNQNIFTKEEIKKLEQYTNQYIEKNINDLINKLRYDVKSDIIGFGYLISINHPKFWKTIEKEWYTHFKLAEFDIKVDSTLVQTGLTSKPVQME